LVHRTNCERSLTFHETPGSADDPSREPRIISAQIRAARLDWQHQVIGPDDVDDQGLGTYVVTFASGDLAETTPGHLLFSGHGLEGFDTKTPVTFVDHPSVTRGEMPGPFGGSVTLHYGAIDGTLDLDADVARELLEDVAREPLTTQFLIQVLGETEVDGVTITDCRLLGVRVLAASRGEVLLEGVPVAKLR
jgi:hypothetical protein